MPLRELMWVCYCQSEQAALGNLCGYVIVSEQAALGNLCGYVIVSVKRLPCAVGNLCGYVIVCVNRLPVTVRELMWVCYCQIYGVTCRLN